MRILALTNLYPNPAQPHRAPFNRHQFRLLNDRHPVRVVAPISWTDELALRRAGKWFAGRRVELDGLTVDHPRYVFPPKLGRGWYGHFFYRSVKPTVRRAIHEFQPDLLFAPWAYPDGWAAVRFGRKFGLPVVIQCHGSDVLLLDRFPGRKRRTAEAVAAADGVVAVSRDIAGALTRLGAAADRVRVIYDGVDRAVFHPGDRAAAREKVGLPAAGRVLLFIGNLLPVKAIDVLLTACAEVKDITLVVVGGGPLRESLENQAKALGVNARFTGPLPQVTLPDWYRAADVFVLPSHSEGVPNVLLEASACGTRWVASRVGGIPEIAHLGDSRLVPPNTPSALAAALNEALNSPLAPPVEGPRDRRAAVDELEEFLGSIVRPASAG